ncbi:LysE family translocator [Pseudoalteromonas phenolica]|uniref:LysE family translocator n=1 Tax=Pseudoalteromonas phenolica TaxID=161398 RepID=UPI001F4F1F23|nr:LysE family transporter [Pseudoalteromonas phenolica]
MIEAVTTLALTTALLLGSPGPAPLALAGVGASFGFKQGLGFLAGILLGLLVAISLVALGLGSLFEQFPTVKLIYQGIATAYLIYVAYKIASNTSGIEQRAGAAPSFKDGFILNLINPKAYAAFFSYFCKLYDPC